MDAKTGVLVSKLAPSEERVPDVEAEMFFSFRPLSGLEIEDAQAAVARELLERYGERVLSALSSLAGNSDPNDPAVQEAKALREKDPLTGYSPTVLLEHGLVGWRGGDVDGVPLDQVSDLEPDTRRWAALKVLEVSRLTEGESRNSVTGIAASDSDGARQPTHSPENG